MHEHLLGAAVVGHPEAGLLLDHRLPAPAPRRPASASASTAGGSPCTRTRSPTLTSLASSCDVQLLGALHRLGVAGVAHALDDGDDGGLVHLAGHRRCPRAPCGRRGVGVLGGVGLVSHQRSPAAASASAAAISRSRSSVLMRAIVAGAAGRAGGVVELAGDVLEAQVEQLLLRLAEPGRRARRRSSSRTR